MPNHLLIQIDLENPHSGLDLKTISYLATLLIEVESQTFQEAVKFVQENVDFVDINCDCSLLHNTDQITALLNAGCTRIFVNPTVLESLIGESLAQDHLQRLTLNLKHVEELQDGGPKQGSLRALGTYVQSIKAGLTICGNLSTLEYLAGDLQGMGLRDRFLVKLSDESYSQASELLKQGLRIIVPSDCLTTDKDVEHSKVYFPSLLTDVIHSDRADGLFPTVVTDERGISLGVVYSNKESIEKAVRLGRGVYYSRSRERLWVKGEESGNTQQLISISLDCDNDALEFRIRQTGVGKLFLYALHMPFLPRLTFKGFVIWKEPPVLALMPESHDWRQRYRIVDDLLPQVLTPRDCSATQSCSRPRSWRKLANSVKPLTKKTLPMKQQICCILL